jgi:IS5 family transposase
VAENLTAVCGYWRDLTCVWRIADCDKISDSPHTSAAAADITQLPALLHGRERGVFGDQAYWKEADRQAYEARGVRYRINRRPNPGRL